MSVGVSHVSIYRWICHFTLFFRTTSHFLLQKADLHADETDIKIRDQQYYLWTLLYSEIRVLIAFCLSSVKDNNTALTLFKKSRNVTNAHPLTIVTD